MNSLIQNSEQLGLFLQSAVLIALGEQPLPATRESIAWAIGKIVQATLIALKSGGTLPPDYRYKDITVDFDRVQAYPKYRVTVQPL